VCGETDLSELCNLVTKDDAVRDRLVALLLSGAWTLFAPLNGSFDDVGADVEAFDSDLLEEFLLYHLVEGESLETFDLECVSPNNLLTMANGKDSRTVCVDSVPEWQRGSENDRDDPPRIIVPNIPACTGVVHKIDKALLYTTY